MSVDDARETDRPPKNRSPAQPIAVNVSKKMGVVHRLDISLSQEELCSCRGGVRQKGGIWRHEEWWLCAMGHGSASLTIEGMSEGRWTRRLQSMR